MLTLLITQAILIIFLEICTLIDSFVVNVYNVCFLYLCALGDPKLNYRNLSGHDIFISNTCRHNREKCQSDDVKTIVVLPNRKN